MSGPFDALMTSQYALSAVQVAALIADSTPAVVAAIHAADDVVLTVATVGSEPARFDVVTRPLPPGIRWLRLDALP